MRKYSFELDQDHNIILLDALFDGYSLRLLLDTGASNTVIDLTTIILNGYFYSDSIKTIQIETAKGVTDAKIFRIKELSSLGIFKNDYEVTAYDFLANGIISEFDGVLGLDFFNNSKICIDFIRFEITISD